MLGPHPGDRHLAGGAPAVHQGVFEDPEAPAAQVVGYAAAVITRGPAPVAPAHEEALP
jgi:hypothetical protein